MLASEQLAVSDKLINSYILDDCHVWLSLTIL